MSLNTATFTGTVHGLGVVSVIQSQIDLTGATLTTGVTTLSALYLFNSTLLGAYDWTVTGLFNSYSSTLDAAGGQGSLMALGGPNPGGIHPYPYAPAVDGNLISSRVMKSLYSSVV